MKIIKIKFKCFICKHEYEHKVNPDSRGFFIVPRIHCAKCMVEMDAIVDGARKDSGGEENGLDKSISEQTV